MRHIWKGAAGVNNGCFVEVKCFSHMSVFIFFPQSKSKNGVSGPHLFLEITHPGHKGQREHSESVLLQGVSGGFIQELFFLQT